MELRRSEFTTPENRDLLERSVGPFMTNRTDDIRKVETMLGEAGYKSFDPKTGPSGMSGPVLEKTTRDFQRDHGLKQDGLIYTDGPTIKTLAAQSSETAFSGLKEKLKELHFEERDMRNNSHQGTLDQVTRPDSGWEEYP